MCIFNQEENNENETNKQIEYWKLDGMGLKRVEISTYVEKDLGVAASDAFNAWGFQNSKPQWKNKIRIQLCNVIFIEKN